ncbi:MAG: hypothetical protein QXY62_03690 [Candidatus Altiarchaeota archaeon]
MDVIQLTLWFGLGVIAQAIFSIYDKLNSENSKKLALCLFASLVFIVFVELSTAGENLKELYNPNFHVFWGFMYFVFFTVIFAVTFKKELLPRISEQTILFFTLIFWYAFFTFYSKISFKDVVIVLALIPTIVAIVISFINWELKFFWKLLLYIWFLIIILFLFLAQFSFGSISFFYKQKGFEALSYFDTLVSGMVFFILTTNFFYLIQVIPYGQGSSFKENLERSREHVKLLVEKFSDYQLNPFHSLLIISFFGGFLAINFYLKLIEDFLLINILIVVPQLISMFLEN